MTKTLTDFGAIRGNGFSTADVMSLAAYRNAQALKLGVNPQTLLRDSSSQDLLKARELGGARDIEFLRGAAVQSGLFDAELDVPQAICGRLLQHIHSPNVRAALMLAYQGAFDAYVYDAFQTVDTTKAWTYETDNLSLRAEERIVPQTMPIAERLGRGATAPRQAVASIDAWMRLGRYANMFTVDEIDFVNNSATRVMREQLRAMMDSALAVRPDLVYAILLANPQMADGVTLFHASRGNLLTGTSLDEAGLTAAMAALAKQKVGDRQLNTRGAYLIVAPSKERAAQKLAKDVFVDDGESSRPPVVISDSRLELGVKDPWSGTTFAGDADNWFLAADPAQRPAIEVAFLIGTDRKPVLRTDFLTQGQFGVSADVCFYIGAKAVDPQGIVRVEG